MRTDKPWKTKTEEITAAKTEAKKWEKEYKEIRKEGTSEQRTEIKDKCIESTTNLKMKLEKHKEKTTNKRVAKILAATKSIQMPSGM